MIPRGAMIKLKDEILKPCVFALLMSDHHYSLVPRGIIPQTMQTTGGVALTKKSQKSYDCLNFAHYFYFDLRFYFTVKLNLLTFSSKFKVRPEK